jgi:hypothetical protein
MHSQISHDIKFDDNEQAKKTKNNDMLHNLQDEEVGNDILKDLKASINDTNTESEGGSEFEMFDRLPTPNSISVDNEENMAINQVFQVIQEQEQSLENTEQPTNTNIQMEICEIIEQIQSSIESSINKVETLDSESIESREKVIETAIETAKVQEEEKTNSDIISQSNFPVNDDEMSVVTMNSSNDTKESEDKKEEHSQPVKKKRTYKPRKKKET